MDMMWSGTIHNVFDRYHVLDMIVFILMYFDKDMMLFPRTIELRGVLPV